MNQTDQRKGDSLTRSENYLGTHAAALGVISTSAGQQQLAAANAAIAAFGHEQSAADRTIAGQGSTERALANDLKSQHMVPIASFARARLRGAPGFASLTRPFGRLEVPHLIRAARTMATEVSQHIDEFIAGGFPPYFVAELTGSANALEGARAAAASAKGKRVGSREGIARELKAGREAVKMLDAVITRHLATNPSLLAEWKQVQRVTLKRGPVRTRGGAVETGITPIDTGTSAESGALTLSASSTQVANAA